MFISFKKEKKKEVCQKPFLVITNHRLTNYTDFIPFIISNLKKTRF